MSSSSRHDGDGLSRGAAYLMLGDVTGANNVADADATFIGEADHDRAGSAWPSWATPTATASTTSWSVPSPEDAGGSEAGAAYLVLGPVAGAFSLSDADAKLIGEAGDDHAGLVVAAAGDTDGDGNADFYVSAPARQHRLGHGCHLPHPRSHH